MALFDKTRNYLVLAACIATCGATACHKSGEPSYQAQWPDACKKVKAHLDEAKASVVAKPLPAAKPGDPWMLVLDGVGIGLPDDVHIEKVSRTKTHGSVVLRGPKETILVMSDPPSPTIDDVFAQVGVTVGKNHAAITRKLFGRSPTVSDMAYIGYHHTPADLTCASKNADAEVPIAMGLLLKRTGLTADEVYSVESLHALIQYRKGAPHSTIEIDLPTPHTDSLVAFMSDDPAKPREQLHNLRLVPHGKAAGPAWVAALGPALMHPSDDALWKKIAPTPTPRLDPDVRPEGTH